MFASKKAGGPSAPSPAAAPPSEPSSPDLKSFSSMDGDDAGTPARAMSLLRVIKENAVNEAWEDAEMVPDAILALPGDREPSGILVHSDVRALAR